LFSCSPGLLSGAILSQIREAELLDRVFGGWTLGAKFFAYSGWPFSLTNGQLGGAINANFGGTILADMKDFSVLGKHCTKEAVNNACLLQSQFVVTTTTN